MSLPGGTRYGASLTRTRPDIFRFAQQTPTLTTVAPMAIIPLKGCFWPAMATSTAPRLFTGPIMVRYFG
jgi:hypothetical protein